MSLIHNERWKLTATGLNGLAITTIAAGALTPLIAATYGIAGTSGGFLLSLSASSGFQPEFAYI